MSSIINFLVLRSIEIRIVGEKLQYKFKMSSCCLGWIQVRILLGKNFLSKLRTPMGTFLEILSPVLMILVLVIAFQLSEVTERGAQQYSTINFEFPGPWINLADEVVNLLDINDKSPRRKLFTKEADGAAAKWVMDTYNFVLPKVHGLSKFRQQATIATRRRLQTDNNNTNNDEMTTEEENQKDGGGNVFDLLNTARLQIDSLLTNPIPVPKFDEYVTASSQLSSLINADDLPIILSDSSFGRSWGNLLTLGTLHITSPEDDVVNEFVAYLNETYPSIVQNQTLNILIHESEELALNFINDNLNERTWALIHLKTIETEKVEYKIRMNYTTLPNTNRIVNFVSIGLNKDYVQYYLSGYLTLQRTLNEFAMTRSGCNNNDTTSNNKDNIWSMPMPTAAYEQNVFFQAVGYLLGLTIAMAFMYPTSRTIKTIVEEKETRMKETLLILGVQPWAHWFSWFITSNIIFVIIGILVSWTLTSNILIRSDSFYILNLILWFSTATVGFCFVVAACFSRAKLAAIVGPMAFFATLLPRFLFFGTNRFEATNAKVWASLLPCTAFAFGADIIADYEYSEAGIQAWNASDGEYSFNTAIGMLLFDTVLYTFLGWYLELVIPRQYGVARPFYFLLLPSYWKSCFCRSTTQEITDEHKSSLVAEEVSNFEDMTDTSLTPQVFIQGLVKKYNKEANIAVDNLNLKLYESQITCLLGHNGAGKTTTISILTGLFPPSSGDCLIYGNSIVRNPNDIRQSMGVCPQHNVLFERLTVEEHLNFFQKIKGMKPTSTSSQECAEEIGLGDHLKTTSIALSGGNKRKLCLAIALSGDPKFLLLDEPTSGMDVASRRNCWELLRHKRKGRVTLLTTHFLDEASLLADRIAIMKEGKLQCCGSELFLKDRFGLGYNLTVVLNGKKIEDRSSVKPSKNDNSPEDILVEKPAVLEGNNINDVIMLLNQHIEDTMLIRKSARELTFRFPRGSEVHFPDMLDALARERERLAIGAYGISDTTLEEIFLQLAEDDAESENFEDDKSIVSNTDTSDLLQKESNDSSRDTVVQHLGPLKQIMLLYKKRFLIQRRDIKGAFFHIILPVILFGLILLILTLEAPLAGPPIEMSMSIYDTENNGFATTDIVVGGGVSLGNKTSNATKFLVEEEFESIRSSFYDQYPNANFVLLENETSSLNLSHHLLDTYNNKDHLIRYGSFSLFDQINMNIQVDGRALWRDSVKLLGLKEGINVNWDPFQKLISDFFDLNSTSKVVLTDYLGLNASSLVNFNISVPTLGEFLNIDKFIESNNNSGVLYTDLFQNITQDVISRINQVSTLSDPMYGSNAVESFRTALRAFNQSVNDEGSNATILDAAAMFLNDLLSIVTRDAILDISTTTVKEIAETLLAQDEIFDRSVLVTGLHEIFYTFLEPFGVTKNIVRAVTTFVIAILDSLVLLLGNETIQSAPNDLLILPIVMLDEYAVGLVEKFGSNSTVSLDKLLLSFVESIENSALWQSGHLSMVVNEILMDIPSLALSFLGVSLNSTFENLDVEFMIENATFYISSMLLSLQQITVNAMSEVLLLEENVMLNLKSIGINAFEEFLPLQPSQLNLKFDTSTTILHNSSSPHAVGVFNQVYMEHLFKQCVGNTGTSRLVSINHPLPLTDQQAIEVQTILSVLASLFLLIPFCYIPGAFIVFLVKERISKSKHLQLVSGVNLTSYWISSYLWDLTLFSMLTVLIMFVFLMYGGDSAVVFVGDWESAIASMAIIFGYGLSVLPFSYLLSRMFNNHSSAQIAVMGINFVCGFVAVNAYFVMINIEDTKALAKALQPWFRCWPSYNIGEAFIQLSTTFWQRKILGADKNPLDWDVTGKSLVLLYGLSFPYFLLLLLLEYSADGGAGGAIGRFLRRARGAYANATLYWYGVRKGVDGISLTLEDGLDEYWKEDEDVIDEKNHVRKNRKELLSKSSVLIYNVWKIYPPSVGFFSGVLSSIRIFLCCGCHRSKNSRYSEGKKINTSSFPKRAVRGISTVVMPGETYGLLGVNGAGKTTTLGMLTGDISSTGGQAYVAGNDISGFTPGGVAEARKNIGFCPQVDPLLDLMTGRETLRLFGSLRGIDKSCLEEVVSKLINRLTLSPHADKPAHSYSGGNKRKLSLGIALIGDPKVLFIDEASSGMDPSSRRKTWKLIEQAAKTRSVILTSHTMEEIEALCTRVSIMVNGQFLCLGSIQHLKSKYLDGYTVEIRCQRDASDATIDDILATISTSVLPGSMLEERHGRFLRFETSSSTSISLASTFKELQRLKESASIANYSISQCSLEQVFLKLVSQASTEKDEV